MIFLFSIWSVTTFLLLIVLGGAGYYLFIMIPANVLKAGKALGLSYKEIWRLHERNIPIVDFVNNLEKSQKSDLDMDFDELMEFFQFHGKKVEGYVDHLIAFRSTGINLPREAIIEHYLKGADVTRLQEIRHVAVKAELELDWAKLIISGIPSDDLRIFIDALIRAQKAGLYVSKDKLAAIDPDTRDKMEDSVITQQGLMSHYNAKIDVAKYVDAMILAKRAGVEISKEALDLHYLTDGDMMRLVSNMIKIKKAGLSIDQVTLMQQRLVGGNMESLVDSLIKAKTADLKDLNIHDIIDFHLVGGNVTDFVNALDIIENNNIPLTKDDLSKHALAKGNIVSFAKALAAVKENNLSITKDQLEDASINGIDVGDVVSTVVATKGRAYEISYGFAVKISSKGVLISDAINWAIKPQVLKIDPPPAVVAQNGIQVIPHITVTIRGKMDKYFSDSREGVIFDRVKEALITEVETFGTHDDILHNLEWISKRVLYQLQGRMELPRSKYKPQKQIDEDIKMNNQKENRLNEESAYEILDISIYDIEIGKDIYRELRERETEFARLMSKKESEKRISIARAEEEEAKARAIKARAKLHEGMAKAFEQGRSVSKDYLKGEIFGYGEDKELNP